MLRTTLKLMVSAAFVGAAPATLAANFSTMYVFGDSLSDNGNFYGYTASPNPVTGGFAVPIAPPYAQGRFQNGPNYAEHLYTGLGFSGQLTARGYTGLAPAGTNYAVGGARSRYHNLDVNPSTGLPPTGTPNFANFGLLAQMDLFQADMGSSFDSNALYVVNHGSNDLQDALALFSVGNFQAGQARLNEAVGDVFSVVSELAAGGAKHLFIPNLADVGRVPAVLALGPQAASGATFAAQAFNLSLDILLSGLEGSQPELNLIRFDTFSFLNTLAADPASGFSNITGTCLTGLFVAVQTGPINVCSNPDEFFFWDSVHPTAKVHQLSAEAMLNTIAPVPVPAAGWLLVGAVSLLATRVKRAA